MINITWWNFRFNKDSKLSFTKNVLNSYNFSVWVDCSALSSLKLWVWKSLTVTSCVVFALQGTPARWRDFHSATIIGTKMFVFGGRADRLGPFHSNNEVYCNKIRVFDTKTNCWLTTPSTQPLPEGRRSHSACKAQNTRIKSTVLLDHYLIKFF